MTTQQQPGFQGPEEPEEELGRQEAAPTQSIVWAKRMGHHHPAMGFSQQGPESKRICIQILSSILERN